MNVMPQSQGNLVDLLDRVLDRGLVIDADIIISLAGVPLIGLNLRAALAGMETMLNYGFLRERDQDIRAQALDIISPLNPLQTVTPTVGASGQGS